MGFSFSNKNLYNSIQQLYTKRYKLSKKPQKDFHLLNQLKSITFFLFNPSNFFLIQTYSCSTYDYRREYVG